MSSSFNENLEMSNKDIKNLFNKNLKILAAKIDSHKVNNLLNNKHFKEYVYSRTGHGHIHVLIYNTLQILIKNSENC